PDALQLHQWLDMSQDQVVIMEVSSHGIDQERTSGIDFDFAIFTNLTHDHLDYHHSLERYFATKARLFQQIKGQGEAVVFSGNSWGRKLSEQLLTSRTPVRTYGNSLDDFIRISRVVSESPLEFEICEDQHNFYRVKLPLSGLYNAHNALAAWTTARRIGVDTKSIIQAFRTFPGVPGRFEVYAHPAGAECIVDYAHTPDGFNHFLKTLQTRKTGRLIHLFGFRGNSDPSKRESMLNITSGISDIVILTLDDTKGVNATELIKEIKTMIKQRSNGCLYFIEDRTKAIEWAWDQARQGDCIAITGKGHENYENQFELPCRSDRETLNYLFQQYSSNA
uniref:Mur ligase family protein n=1 Tax=Saccharibacillus qingshengii TaxID=1763540 RepID=UPI001553C73B